MHIRQEQIDLLQQNFDSGKSSFSVVYGRRRIGKTQMIDFLIKESQLPALCVTGSIDMNLQSALRHVTEHFAATFGIPLEKLQMKDWHDFFHALQTELEQPANKKYPFILFFDEAPWLAEMKESGFLSELALFWNGFASKTDRIHLILCGSAASWIVANVIEDTGPLYDRVQCKILLKPFTLKQTKSYLENECALAGITYREVLEYYMAFGGVATYLNQIQKGFSVAQNIQRICFSTSAEKMASEYMLLFSSMFKRSKMHRKVVEALAEKWKGLTQDELIKKQGITSGGELTQALQELELCGFIMKIPFSGSKRHTLYRVIDPFIYFHRRWMDGLSAADKAANPDYWINIESSSEADKWRGYAFESICHLHVPSIRESRRITQINLEHRYINISKEETPLSKGAQIDLLLLRDDKQADIIECKYYRNPYPLNAAALKALQTKKEVLEEYLKNRYAVKIVILASNGVKYSKDNRKWIDQELRIEDLFLA